MIPSIYYKLKYIFRMFYDKVYFIFYSVKPTLVLTNSKKLYKYKLKMYLRIKKRFVLLRFK